jgi:hypothetical protein
VAVALDVARLKGKPVALPLPALLGGMGAVRAHFYASFHSGRRENNPISRHTLEDITHVPARTQYHYEEITHTQRQRNIAVGERYSQERLQERAWQHGRAAFAFIDHLGLQGEERKDYIAWHLPNSYTPCHSQSPRGRQKKMNQQIDLVSKRARGNGLQKARRIFHLDAVKAGKAHKRNNQQDDCWRNRKTPSKNKTLWYVLPNSV